MAGTDELSPPSVTSVSRIHLPFRICLLISVSVALDGTMILFAMIVLSIFHPGRLLDRDEPTVDEKKNDLVAAA